MAFGTNSNIFRQYINDQLTLALTTKINVASGGDTIKVALYGNTGTPDRNATTATLTSYNGTASQWVVANEVSQVGQWAAGGVTLAGQSVNEATANTVFFTGTNSASGSAFTTPSPAYGCLVYSTTATNGATVTNPGICFLAFGGPNSVTNGTLTVAYAASPSGIFNITV